MQQKKETLTENKEYIDYSVINYQLFCCLSLGFDYSSHSPGH